MEPRFDRKAQTVLGSHEAHSPHWLVLETRIGTELLRQLEEYRSVQDLHELAVDRSPVVGKNESYLIGSRLVSIWCWGHGDQTVTASDFNTRGLPLGARIKYSTLDLQSGCRCTL